MVAGARGGVATVAEATVAEAAAADWEVVEREAVGLEAEEAPVDRFRGFVEGKTEAADLAAAAVAAADLVAEAAKTEAARAEAAQRFKASTWNSKVPDVRARLRDAERETPTANNHIIAGGLLFLTANFVMVFSWLAG